MISHRNSSTIVPLIDNVLAKRVEVFLLVVFFLTMTFMTTVTYAMSVDKHLMTDDPKANTGCTTPTAKTIFTPTDSSAYSWVLVSGAFPLGDSLTWKWYAPDNSLYASYPLAITIAGSLCAYSWIDINGQAAANKPGQWRVEIYKGGTLAATDTFTIDSPPAACTYTFSDWGPCQPNGTQTRTIVSSSPGCIDWAPQLTQACTYVPPARPPQITFNPASTTQLSGGQVFTFSFSIDFGSTPQVSSFAISYNDIDITQLFVSALAAGYVKLSVQGNIVTLTIQGLSLPSGQHEITVSVGSSGGITKADWSVNVTAPRYTFSADQQDLIKNNGNPDYLSIAFNSTPQRREETWVYTKLQKMYVFWDGLRLQEKSAVIDPAAYSKPPALDPSLFTKDTKLPDLVQLLGSNYTSVDQSSLNIVMGTLNLKTYYFSDKALYVSFLDDTLVGLQTIDIGFGGGN